MEECQRGQQLRGYLIDKKQERNEVNPKVLIKNFGVHFKNFLAFNV